jgi:hypothetical protein
MFFAAALLLSAAAEAQYAKGTKMIGATLATGNFTAGTTDYSYPAAQGFKVDSRNFSLSLSPSYGVFVNGNTAVGFSLLVNTSSNKTDYKTLRDTTYSSNTSRTTDFGAGAFLRYYLNTDPKKINPFLHAFANGGSGIGSQEGFEYGTDPAGPYKDTYDGKASGRVFLNTGLNLGVTKLLNPSVGLDIYAGYVFSYSKLTTKVTNLRDYTTGADLTQTFEPTQKYMGNGVQLGIGVQVFLGK